MSNSIEIEVTYLAARLPENLAQYKHVELEDIYFPDTVDHPKLRIRKQDNSYEFTKKTQLDSNDAGQQKEENVSLTRAEYEALAAGNGRKISKTRYFMPYKGVVAEINVYREEMVGLVVIEFEFKSVAAKNAFTMPDFCLADITQEEFAAGGKFAGKTYEDIEQDLKRFNYQPLYL